MVQASLDKMRDPIFKTTRTKGTGDIFQVVENLSSKCKAISSNASTTKKNYFKLMTQLRKTRNHSFLNY
jgi:hypothetical protein